MPDERPQGRQQRRRVHVRERRADDNVRGARRFGARRAAAAVHVGALPGVGALVDARVGWRRRHQARSYSHWFPYDRVGVVNADP
eukprot:52-Pelagococcus_subviridis.AAC.1